MEYKKLSNGELHAVLKRLYPLLPPDQLRVDKTNRYMITAFLEAIGDRSATGSADRRRSSKRPKDPINE